MKIKILVLMTVTIIFLTVQFLVLPVKGQEKMGVENTLVILEGKVEKSYYELPGYAIIQNNVISDEVGEYEIVYQSLDDGMIYSRKVVVIDRNTKEYFNLESCSIDTFKNYPMTLEKSVSLSANEQILLVRYLTDKAKNIGHLYMYYIRDTNIVKEVQLFYNVELEVNDLLVDGSEFVVIGRMWNSLYANYDIVFVVCDKNGLRKTSQIIGGSKTDEGVTGVVVEDGYLIMGKTDSTDKVFDDNKKEGSFIMKISKTDYQIIKKVYYTNYPNISPTKLIKTLNGLFFLYSNGIDQLELVQINNEGENLKSKKITFDENINLQEVYVASNKIMVILDKNNQIEIGEITFKGYTKQYESKEKGKMLSCYYQDDVLSLIYQQDEGYKLLILKSDFEKVYEKELYKSSIISNHLILQQQAIIEDLTNNGTIKIHKLEYLKIFTMGKVNLDQQTENYHDYQVIINGKKVEHCSLTDNTDQEVFGDYPVTYFFDEEVDLLFTKNIKVNSGCNFENGNVYDLGVKVNFKGMAYLNNERIEPGFTITEEGTYTLEIIGKNETSEIINFEVRDLSIKNDFVENLATKLDLQIEEPLKEKSVLNYNVVLNNEEKTSNVNNLWDWMYTVPALLTLGLGFVIIKFKY